MAPVEIEAKYAVRCSELPIIEDRLKDLGAHPEGERREEDIYYRHPCRDFLATDEGLRLRIVDGRPESLTYKGPRLPGKVKRRTELILPLSRGPAGEILERLGFAPAIRVAKDRKYYRLEGALVTLDRVEGLGCYVEVEAGSPEEVLRIARLLGLAGEPITASYAELAARRRGLLPQG